MFGPHAAFIIPSYIATLIVVAVLIGWIIVVYRHRLKEIADLEARGIQRGGGQRQRSSQQEETS